MGASAEYEHVQGGAKINWQSINVHGWLKI